MENYLLERKLREEDKDLHKRAADSIFVLQTMLSKYLTRFPNFTDHSVLHSMNVLDYCNRILGYEQINKLCPEECYVLIMGCYLHDIGMGIGSRDYAEFSKKLDFGDFFDDHDRDDDAVTLQTRPKTAEYRPKIETLADKITDTLSYCRTVAEQTSDLRIRQNRIIVNEL